MDARYKRKVVAIGLGVILVLPLIAEVLGFASPSTVSRVSSVAGVLTLFFTMLGWNSLPQSAENPPPDVRGAFLDACVEEGVFALRVRLEVTNRSAFPWWIEQALLYDDHGRRIGASVDRRKLGSYEEATVALLTQPAVLSGTTRLAEANGGRAYSSITLQPFHVLDNAVCIEIDFVDSRRGVFRLNFPVMRDLNNVESGMMAAYERTKDVVRFRCDAFHPVPMAEAWPQPRVLDPQFVDLGDADLDEVLRSLQR